MATQSTIKRAQYRSLQARLISVARGARELLDSYSWTDGDGKVFFITEPVGVTDDFSVRQRWSELRANLILAGQLEGEQQPGALPGGIFKFLRVQSFDKPTSVTNVFQWQTRSIYEVLTGVNSYGYAEGAAYDLFLDLFRKYQVRVLLQETTDRLGYLNADYQAVTVTTVVGDIPPFSSPNLTLGWAIISDQTGNPEPDFFGLESSRVVVITTGLEGPQGIPGVAGEEGLPGFDGEDGLPGIQGKPGVEGPSGPQGPGGAVGPRGPRGLPGSGGGVVDAPVVQLGAPQEGDEYMLVQPLWLNAAVTGGVAIYEAVGIRCVGGSASDDGAVLAGYAVQQYLDLNGFDEQYNRPVGPDNPDGVGKVCKLVRVQDGALIMTWRDGVGAQHYVPGQVLLINLWLGGALFDSFTDLTFMRAGTASLDASVFVAVVAHEGANVYERVTGVDGSLAHVVFANDPLNVVVATRRNDELA